MNFKIWRHIIGFSLFFYLKPITTFIKMLTLKEKIYIILYYIIIKLILEDKSLTLFLSQLLDLSKCYL